MNGPSLAETAAAFIKIRDAFMDDDLREEVGAARFEFKKRFPNLHWQTGLNGELEIFANELAALTGDSKADCLTAINQAFGCDWPTVAQRADQRRTQ